MRIDDAAQFAAGWDWITPLETLVRDWLHGPIHRFAVPYGAGWSGKQIGRLLKGYGVPSWGWLVRYDTIFFRVRLKQARWAQYVMLREGVPLEEGWLAGGDGVSYGQPSGVPRMAFATGPEKQQRQGWLAGVREALGL